MSENYERMYEEYINKGPDGTELSGAELEALLSWRDQHPVERLDVERRLEAKRHKEERLRLLEATHMAHGGDSTQARQWAQQQYATEVAEAAQASEAEGRRASWSIIRESF